MAAHKRPRLEAGAKADLLDTLAAAVAAAPTLVRFMQDCNSLQIVRLACRGLRAYVDEHVSTLAIVVSPTDEARWAAGLLPSLARWPSCSTVYLTLNTSRANPRLVDYSSFAMVAFQGLSRQSRERIQHLRVSCLSPIVPSWRAEELVSSFASSLSGLRRLSLKGLSRMSYGSADLEYMYGMLASLPHLHELELPSCRALNRIGALEDKLATLQVRPNNKAKNSLMTARAAEGLSKLHVLRSIMFGSRFFKAAAAAPVKASPNKSLRRVFDNLPPSVGLVTFRDRAPGAKSSHVAVRLELADGHISVFEASRVGNRTFGAGLDSIANLAAALDGSRALGPPLDRVSLDVLSVGSGEALDAPAYAPLWSLLRRCWRLDVGELHTTSAAAAVRAVAEFGKPRRLVLQSAQGERPGRVCLQLRAAPADKARWLLDAPQEVQRRVQDAASLPPSPLRPNIPPSQLRPAIPLSQRASRHAASEAASRDAGFLVGLLQAVLGRLARGAAGACPCSGSDSAAAAATAEYAGTSGAAAAAPPPEFAFAQSPACQLLLRGALVAPRARDPESLGEWMRMLSMRAAAVAMARQAAAVGAGGAAASSCRKLSYRALPAAGAVLLTFSDPVAAADIAAAVAVVAETWHSVPSGERSLQAVPVAAEAAAEAMAGAGLGETIGEQRGPTGAFPLEAVLQVLQQVLQSTWERGLGSCCGGPAAELALLRRLLGGWEQLAAEVPAEVALE